MTMTADSPHPARDVGLAAAIARVLEDLLGGAVLDEDARAGITLAVVSTEKKAVRSLTRVACCMLCVTMTMVYRDNRPFMFSGLALRAAGLGWLAAVTKPGIGYGTLVAPLIVAGVGIAMCFPAVANAVTASVPDGDVGVAASTNNALNALGGVFGVAILAAVFAARGSYATPAVVIHGFRPAEWTAAAVAAVGVPVAALAPPKSATAELR